LVHREPPVHLECKDHPAHKVSQDVAVRQDRRASEAHEGRGGTEAGGDLLVVRVWLVQEEHRVHLVLVVTLAVLVPPGHVARRVLLAPLVHPRWLPAQ